ncbi:hypothetical protein [Haladaptatus sp. DFWS20]|uniref:hypothetical protein n=1 Tax=Haladaptatus sp. DFWS20 TaxID=3403467 RepID=UPI003EBF8DD4
MASTVRIGDPTWLVTNPVVRGRRYRKFSTVCERESPEEQATAPGHPAACHLHDSVAEVEEWDWVSVD